MIQLDSDPEFFLARGAVAGAASALAFTALHQLIISDIWFSVVPMMTAGAVCGICLAWSYGRLFQPPSAATLWRYNLTYVGLLAALGLASIVLFEPLTTIPALLAAKRPPVALFRKAVPVTAAFTLGSALVIWLRWGRSVVDAVAVLVTCTVVVLVLGLNVSIMGLVRLTRGGVALVAEQFALSLFLGVVYVAVFQLLGGSGVRSKRI